MHREVAQPLRKGHGVLFDQDGGGGQHCDLAAAQRGQQRGAQSYFRLAVAHVAAHQTIHRRLVLHVGQYCRDGPLLVGGFLEREGFLELAEDDVRGRESMAR